MILPKDGLTSDSSPVSASSSARRPRAFRRTEIREEDLPRAIGSVLRARDREDAPTAEYTLLRVIGVGPRGAVYEVERGGRTHALKVLRPEHRVDVETLELWREESARGPLRHPNLARVLDQGEDGNCAFVVRQLLRGDSLATVLLDIAEGRASAPHLSPLAPRLDGSPRPGFYRHAVSLFAELAAALALVHERGPDAPIVHGRIHPANLIFSPAGRLVLCDFEGADDPRSPPTAAADTFDLAAALHHLVFRRPVTRGAAFPLDSRIEADHDFDPRSTERRVASELRAVLDRATAADPSARYESARAFAEDLKRLVELEPTEAAAQFERSDPELESRAVAEECSSDSGASDSGASDDGDSDASDAVEARTMLIEQPSRDTETHETTARAVPDSTAERELLLEGIRPTPPATTTVRSRRSRAVVIVLTTLAFVLLLVGATWLALALHERGESYRTRMENVQARAATLDRGVTHLRQAVAALADDDATRAATLLDSAREVDREGSLHEFAERLRLDAADPVVTRLVSPLAAARADAIETLASEVAGGRRHRDGLDAIARCLWDDDLRVRRQAIATCARFGLVGAILEAYPVGAGETMRVDSATLFALYRGLGRAAIDGREGAAAALRTLRFEELDRLDAELARVAVGLNAAPSHEPTELAVSSTVVVDLTTHPTSESFAREWLAINARLDGAAELQRLFPTLSERRDLLPDLIEQLEVAGDDWAIDALRGLADRWFLHEGAGILAALKRLDAADAILDLVSGPLPLPFRELAMRTAIETIETRGAISDHRRDLEIVARSCRTHPERTIRRIAFDGLRRTSYFENDARPLVSALGDPSLREDAIAHLEKRPNEEATPSLVELLPRTALNTRLRVIRALAATGSPDVLEPLARQLVETDPLLRQTLLSALETLGDDRALAFAVGILGRHHPALEGFAHSLLVAARANRREDPQRLVLALQELFDLTTPVGDALDASELRKAILLAPLVAEGLERFDRRMPERIRAITEPPAESARHGER